jgi:hypothetical protein
MASPYAGRSGRSGGSSYAGRSKYGGSAYSGRSGTASAPAPTKSGGSGIGHFFKKLGVNLKDVAYHAPGGFVQINKALLHDMTHPPKHGQNSQLSDIAVGTGKQIKTDLSHPLRNPGYTLLDLLPVANTTAKLAEAARVAKAGGTVGEVAKATVTRPVYPSRTLRHGAVEIKVGSSQSALGAVSQRLGDKALHTLAERKPGGVGDRLLTRKVGKAVAAEARVVQDSHKAAGASLVAMGKKLKPAEQKALQVVAEEAPLHGRITATSARITGAKTPKLRRRHQAELDLLHQAKAHLTEADGKPAFTGPNAAKLNKTLAVMRNVAGSREDLLKGLGQLTDESIQSRKTNAARVSLGATYEKVGARKGRVEQVREYPARSKTVTREMSDAEAQQRLAGLDKTYTELVHKLVPETSPYGGAISQREQLRRNFENSRAGKGNRVGAKRQRTVKQEEFRLAEDKLLQTAERNRGHAAADKVLALVEERDRLRHTLNERSALGESAVPPNLPTVSETIAGKPRRVHLREVAAQKAGGRIAGPRQTFEGRLAANPDALVKEYEKRFGNVVNTDAARELSPEYSASNESRAALASTVHEPASALAKLVYERKLARPPRKDKTVTFTGGGTGAGKTTAAIADAASHDIVFDTNLNSVESSVAKIEQALKSGRNVAIRYVYRDPVASLHGALHRAHRMGRTVPLVEHVKTHVGSNAAIRKIAKRYANDPRVKISVIDNTVKGASREISLADLPNLVHTEVSHATRKALEAENAAGRVTADVYRGFAFDAGRAARTDGPSVARDHGAYAPEPGQGVAGSEPHAALLGADGFTASPEAIRIPDVATRAGRSLGRRGGVGSAGSVGHLKALGSTTHEYTGALRENAVRREDTTALVGESAMESAKYAGLKHVHELVRKAVTEHPQSASDVAVRLEGLKSSKRMPLEVRRFIDNPEEFFRNSTPAEQASAFEGVRTRLFINTKHLDAEAAAEFNKLSADGKIGWVPRALLGDLAKPHLPYTGKAVKTVDAINNASRFAILYTKPAYAIPNLLGNVALNVLQQGFAAVPNLARAAKLNGHLGPELTARIDTLMGEGFARAISAHGQGLAAGVVDKAASFWSKGVDTPFRRSSFLYEAKRLGYKTPAELEHLLTSPDHLQQLVEVTQRANREIIDYANLTPTEREVIRRVVFFYPWVKGSTVYAGRFLREHPVKAAAVGQVGALGKQNDPVAPSYLEGVFPVGGRLVNPTSTSILQTPAQVGQALAGLAGGDVGQVGELSNFLSPASALALAAVTRRDRQGYQYPAGSNLGGIAADQLVKHVPQYTLGQRISDALNGKGQDRLYPPNILDAILQYTVGGVAPRKYNKAKLAELAANERSRYIP